MSALGLRLHQAQLGPVRLASNEDVAALLREASQATGEHKFSALFLRTEWDQVVDAWQLSTWEAYRDVQRLGRRTRLPEARRAVLWKVFERVREGLKTRGLKTESAMFQALTAAQAERPAPAYDAAVVKAFEMKEVQDDPSYSWALDTLFGIRGSLERARDEARSGVGRRG